MVLVAAESRKTSFPPSHLLRLLNRFCVRYVEGGYERGLVLRVIETVEELKLESLRKVGGGGGGDESNF